MRLTALGRRHGLVKAALTRRGRPATPTTTTTCTHTMMHFGPCVARPASATRLNSLHTLPYGKDNFESIGHF